VATKRLGRGLEALIRPLEPAEPAPGAGVVPLPLKSIKVNPHQPRKSGFDERSLEELANSIRSKGVVTPVTVRQEGSDYILIAGERRWRAAQLAGLKEIPAYIIEVTNEAEMVEMALIENLQRENLNPLEEAEAYALLQSKFNLSQQAIAKAVGKNRVTVTNALRLLKLPSEIKQSLRGGTLSAGHGRALLALKTKSAMLKLWRRILHEDLSVRAVEALASKKTSTSTSSPAQKRSSVSPAVRRIEDELVTLLGTKVKLKPHGKQGTIVINYYSAEDLERILELLRSLQ